MKFPTTLLPAVTRLLALFKRSSSLPTDSNATVSSIWVVPDALQDAFTTTLTAGQTFTIAWQGGMAANTTADLWVAAYAYDDSDSFSQLLTSMFHNET